MLTNILLQSGNKQEDEGDCGPGAELSKLQPAVTEGAAVRPEQQHGAVPDGEHHQGAPDADDPAGAEGDEGDRDGGDVP